MNKVERANRYIDLIRVKSNEALLIIGKTKSTNFQNEKYKKIAFTHFSNVM